MAHNGGVIIKTARKLRGFTQQEIADQYGISRNMLGRYEKERTEPPWRLVSEILEMLDYTSEEINKHVDSNGHENDKASSG